MQTGLVRIRRLGLCALALLAGCTSTSTGTDGISSPLVSLPLSHASAPANWPAYHGNAARTGTVPGLPAAGRLSVSWSARLSGAVYGQPLVVGSTVVAATETDVVYGLNRTSGKVAWHTKVGTPLALNQQPCGNIDPLGITGTGAYDPQTKLVYEVAQSGRTAHVLVGLKVSDGKVAFRRNVPSPDHQPYYDQERAALAVGHGRIYVEFGGHFGDCGPYRGSVLGVPASGHGKIVSYLVAASQAGMWAPGGPVMGPTGTIFVTDGNGSASATRFDGSDAVTALSADLKRTGIFAPKNWRMLSAGDLDLGSTSAALMPDGRILQVGKSGVGYLLNAKHLGGVGGQVASGPVCAAFGGPAVSGSVVYIPCRSGGLAAVDTAGQRVHVKWRGPSAAWGSAVYGGGAIWVASPDSGVLYELSPATGEVRHQISLGGPLPDFASPSLSGNLALVGTLHGVVAVSGV